MKKISTELKIINELQKLKFTEKKIKILELGVGCLNYSKILRKAFEKSYIIGFDVNKKRIKRSVLEILDEIIIKDIRLDRIQNLKESFDLVTFGSTLIDTGFHFGFNKPEIYKSILQSLNYYLKPGGYFFSVTKSNFYENKKQKNYLERNLLYEDRKDEFIMYDKIPSLTKDFLPKFTNLKTFLLKDEDKITKLLPRAEILKTQFDMKRFVDVSNENYEVLKKRAEAVDKAAKEEGVERGYITIQTAVK